MPSKLSQPTADIHTPEELLANAERHFSALDLNAMRAAVLEAIAALETFVQKRVFAALEAKLDPVLVRWLETRTRMDFDARLSILAPVALGRPIDTNDTLWRDYRETRTIRNRVVHAGARVSRERARFVIDTVYRWLAFLGSSVEVQVALLGLKQYFAQRRIAPISTELEAGDLLVRYFSKTNAVQVLRERASSSPQSRPDVLLRFGNYRAVIEAKFTQNQQISALLSEIAAEMPAMMSAYEATVGALVVFHQGQVDPFHRNLLVLHEGRLYVLVVPIQRYFGRLITCAFGFATRVQAGTRGQATL